PVFANGEAQGFAELWQIGRVNHQIYLWHCFFAAPMADLVVDQIEARTAVHNFVPANDFLQMDTNFRAAVRHRQAQETRVLFEAAPVAFVAERFTLNDANRGEQPPPADDAGLPRRKADLLDREKLVVMKDVAMDQESASKEVHPDCITPEKTNGETVGELQ